MCRMYPSILDPDTKSAAERRLYEAFARELSDDWVVFHHVSWIGNDEHGQPCDGEADFVVSHPHLGVLVIEVKGGRIHFDATTGHYASTDRANIDHDIGEPFVQATESKHTLITKLRNMHGWPSYRVVFGHMVAFPDAVVEADWLRPNAPRNIILDALDLVSLEERLRESFAYWKGENTRDVPPGEKGIVVLIRLLWQADRIRNPLLAEQIRDDERALMTLTQGQYRYLRFLAGHRRAAISGCAGSGKTFLAVEKARQLAQEDGLKVLFTCYNRALSDFLGTTLGYRRMFDVFNFHHLCVYWANQAGEHLSYLEDASPDYFDCYLPNALMSAIDGLGTQYDAIIVDEGQDFHAPWWDVLPWLLHDPSNGIFYIFFDDNQRVYRDRCAVPLDVAPYVLNENCRNTQHIYDVVQRFYSGLPSNVLGPEGQPVSILEYANQRQGESELRRLLHTLTGESGFTPEDIAVLSVLGERTSSVLGQRLGNYQLTDQLPLGPNQILATTVRRFKGLERSVIVLCEVDGRMPEEEIEALLYVGTSRAKTYLVVLLGQDAPDIVGAALNSFIEEAPNDGTSRFTSRGEATV